MISNHVSARPFLRGGLLWASSLVAIGADLRGQATSAGRSTTTKTTGKKDIIQLSEFTVSAEKDLGYSTTNAIGVTRTITPIIDPPQAVNVINQEFLRDAAASELYDVLKYVSVISIESNVWDSV